MEFNYCKTISSGVMPNQPYQPNKEYDEKRLRKKTATRESLNFALKSVRSSRLKLVNNSSSLNKGNQDRDGVWIYDLNLVKIFTMLSVRFLLTFSFD